MLQKQAVKPELLELLEKLMLVDEFANFNLVGGTALALYEGHRLSVDIDMFGKSDIDTDKFTDILKEKGETIILSQSPKILIFSINGIKVDFVDYNFELLEPLTIIEGIRLVSKKDIAAMKLNAIAGRGSKKDFFDAFKLLFNAKASVYHCCENVYGQLTTKQCTSFATLNPELLHGICAAPSAHDQRWGTMNMQ